MTMRGRWRIKERSGRMIGEADKEYSSPLLRYAIVGCIEAEGSYNVAPGKRLYHCGVDIRFKLSRSQSDDVLANEN